MIWQQHETNTSGKVIAKLKAEQLIAVIQVKDERLDRKRVLAGKNVQSREHLYPSAAGLDKTLPGFSGLRISPQRFAQIPNVCFGVLLFLCAPDVPVIPS